MLNPLNVHRGAARIKRVGADLKQLTNAFASEMPPSGGHRAHAIEANKLLVCKSNGLLAPVTTDERFLTLGTGHTAAFCKKANVGGRTPQATLQDEKGDIDLQKIKTDPNFRSMLEEGWNFEVIPWEVDTEYPAYAKLAQRALNTSNHVPTEVGELETMVTIADLLVDGEFEGWKAVVAKEVEDLCLPCAPYAATLIQFVSEYGGGPDAPQIRFLDSVAKAFECNVVLGSTMWHALTYTRFFDQTRTYNFLRQALALVNLSTDKQEDGIARMILKADVQKLSVKSNVGKSTAADQTLKEALLIHDTVVKTTGKSKSEFQQVLGQLFVRVGLHVCDKMSLGPDKRNMSLDEIKQKFVTDVSKLAGVEVKFAGWADCPDVPPTTPTTGAPAAEPPAVGTAYTSTDDHSDPKFIAKKHGFTVGQHVTQKGSSAGISQVFRIESITTDEITFKAIHSYSGNYFEGKCTLRELISDFTTSKAEAPQKMDWGQTRPGLLLMEKAKCELVLALQRADNMNAAQKTLEFWRKPDQIRTGATPIRAAALLLAPVTTFVSLSDRASATSLSLGVHDVGGKDVEFFACAPSKPNKAEPEQFNIIAAFWWVYSSTTPNKNEANMELTISRSNGIDVPMLHNKGEIPAYTRLVRYVPAEVKPAKKSVLTPKEDQAAVPKLKARRRS